MESPQVSVIIPAFNRPQRLRRAVESVLEQEGVSFELILVDDCSSAPNSELYSEVIAAGHQVLNQPKNLGPGPARNRGAKEACGEWLAFLDSDDYWLPGKLAKHLDSLNASGLSIGQAEEIWYRDGLRVNPPKAHKIRGGDLFRRSLRAVCVSSSTVMLKSELFHRHGGFDEELFVCEDYDLWLRVSAEELFEFCQEPLVVKHGGHEDQLSQALPVMDRFRVLAIVKALEASHFQGSKKRELASKEVVRKLRILGKGAGKRGNETAQQLCIRSSALVEQGEFKDAVSCLQELAALWPLRT